LLPMPTGSAYRVTHRPNDHDDFLSHKGEYMNTQTNEEFVAELKIWNEFKAKFRESGDKEVDLMKAVTFGINAGKALSSQALSTPIDGEPDDDNKLRVSMSGCSLKVGWGDNKRMVAKYPGDMSNHKQFNQWLEDCDRLMAGWNNTKLQPTPPTTELTDDAILEMPELKKEAAVLIIKLAQSKNYTNETSKEQVIIAAGKMIVKLYDKLEALLSRKSESEAVGEMRCDMTTGHVYMPYWYGTSPALGTLIFTSPQPSDDSKAKDKIVFELSSKLLMLPSDSKGRVARNDMAKLVQDWRDAWNKISKALGQWKGK